MNELILFAEHLASTGRPLSYHEWEAYVSEVDYLNGVTYTIRASHIKHRGFPIVTTEQLTILARLLKDKKTIDIGCGPGWLSEQLLDRGVILAAVDNYSEGYAFNKYTDALNIDALEALEEQGYDAVILSWPCYNTSFAYKVAEALKSGTVLCYQGEGSGGCTGDDSFFETLRNEFTENVAMTKELIKYQRSFWGIRDNWTIYIKK